MKTFKSLLYVLLATFIFAGCSDSDNLVPGAAEDENCYGVYFPSQENVKALELDPADPTVLTFTAKRKQCVGEIIVPLVVKGSADQIFSASELKFADGEEQAEFTVSFPQAVIGTPYQCNVMVIDPQYAQLYNEKQTGFDFSVTRVKWNKLVGAGGEEKGKWRDDIAAPLYSLPVCEGDVDIYERDDKKGYYRIPNVYSAAFIATILGGTAADAPDCEKYRVDAMTYIDATDPAKVWFKLQSTGVTFNSGDGLIAFASVVDENTPFGGSAFKGKSLYGKLQNGVITFPVKGIYISLNGDGWYGGNGSGLLRVMLPGAKAYDYSLALSNSEPADGKVKIAAALGADVAKVKYAFFEGSMSDALAETKSVAMDAGTIETKELTETGIITAEFTKTGVYSIVGNLYNAENKLSGVKYLSFGYIAAGDEKPVVISSGLIISDKHATEGFTSEDSAEAYIYGKEIKSGYYGLFESDGITSATDLAALVEKKDNKFKAEDIKAINDKGFSTVIGGLVGGTDYTLVVSAFNGYVSKIITATATTKGTPHPLKRQYTAADLLEPAITKEALFKKWNFWAVDHFAKPANSKRQKMGSLTFSENTADDDPTQEVDAINVKGLSCGASANDEVVWEFVEGLVASGSGQPLGSFELKGQTYYLDYRFTTTAGKVYDAAYALLGGLVAEGYVAFVANPAYIKQQGITFNGLFEPLYSDKEMTDNLGGFNYITDLMCEDPAVGKASASQAPVTRNQLQEIAQVVFAAPTNCVELRDKALLKVLIREAQTQPKSCVAVPLSNVLRVEAPVLGVAKANVSFSAGITSQRANMRDMKCVLHKNQLIEVK